MRLVFSTRRFLPRLTGFPAVIVPRGKGSMDLPGVAFGTAHLIVSGPYKLLTEVKSSSFAHLFNSRTKQTLTIHFPHFKPSSPRDPDGASLSVYFEGDKVHLYTDSCEHHARLTNESLLVKTTPDGFQTNSVFEPDPCV